MADNGPIRAIVFRDGDAWAAQCLEYDIGAQAETPEAACDRLLLALKCEMSTSMEKNGKPFAGIDPAPKVYFDRWNARSSALSLDHKTIRDDGRRVTLELARVA